MHYNPNSSCNTVHFIMHIVCQLYKLADAIRQVWYEITIENDIEM